MDRIEITGIGESHTGGHHRNMYIYSCELWVNNYSLQDSTNIYSCKHMAVFEKEPDGGYRYVNGTGNRFINKSYKSRQEMLDDIDTRWGNKWFEYLTKYRSNSETVDPLEYIVYHKSF